MSQPNPQPQGEGRLLSPGFLTLLAAQALFGFSFSTYFLLPKYLQVELGAAPGTIGWISGMAWTTSILCVPFTGTLVDRLGRKRFLYLGAAGMVLGCLLFAVNDQLGPALFLARMFQGVGFSFYFVAASTLATDLAPAGRLSQAIGWFGATMVLTNALSPAIAEPLAEAIGWNRVFWGTALFAAAAGLVSLRLSGGPPHGSTSDTPFREVLRVRRLRPVWVVSILAGFLFGCTITFSAPWALDSGYEQVRNYFVAYAGASAFVRFALGGLADRWGRLEVAIGAMVVYGAAPLLLVDVGALGLIVPGLALGLAQGLFYPALNAYAVEWSEARVRATVMALYNGAFNVGFTAGSIGLGVFVEALGYPTTFRVSAGAALLAIVMMATLHHRTRERHPADRDPDATVVN